MESGELPQIIDSADPQPPPPFWYMHDCECSYRRGVVHAICYAIESIQRLKRKQFSRPAEIANIMESWLTSELYPWRSRAALDISQGRIDNGFPRIQQESWDSIRKKVFERDRWRCVSCGKMEVKFHCDHIQSVYDGGLPVLENLQTLCPQCNFEKGST